MAMGPDTTRMQQEWQKLSSQYWDAWRDATRNAFGALAVEPETSKMPWHEGLEQWARMFDARKTNDAQSEVVERMLQGARSYFSLLESLAGGGSGGGATASMNPSAWAHAVRDAFNFPGAEAMLHDNPLARALRELTGEGATGFEQMVRGIEPVMNRTRALLDLPAFGFARERQEQYQRMSKAWLDFQHETNRYNALIARASRRAFEVFEDKLAEHSEPGRQITTVRGLYDLWVDAAEEAYAEVALSSEFRDVYGALVNALMRVRKCLQQEVERLSNDLGVPTRSEVNSIGQRLQALRRAAKEREEGEAALREELAAWRTRQSVSESHAEEVAALKLEMAEWRAERRQVKERAEDIAVLREEIDAWRAGQHEVEDRAGEIATLQAEVATVRAEVTKLKEAVRAAAANTSAAAGAAKTTRRTRQSTTKTGRKTRKE